MGMRMGISQREPASARTSQLLLQTAIIATFSSLLGYSWPWHLADSDHCFSLSVTLWAAQFICRISLCQGPIIALLQAVQLEAEEAHVGPLPWLLPTQLMTLRRLTAPLQQDWIPLSPPCHWSSSYSWCRNKSEVRVRWLRHHRPPRKRIFRVPRSLQQPVL